MVNCEACTETWQRPTQITQASLYARSKMTTPQCIQVWGAQVGCTRLAAEHKSPSQQPTPVAIATPLVPLHHTGCCRAGGPSSAGSTARWRMVGRPCGQLKGASSWARRARMRPCCCLLRGLPIMTDVRHARLASTSRTLRQRTRGVTDMGGAHAAGCTGQIMTLCGRAHAAGCMGLQEATQQAYVCVVSVLVHHVTHAPGRQLDKTMRRRQLTFWGGCPLVVSPQLLSGPTAPAAPPHPMHLLRRQHTAQHMRWRVSGAECS